MRNPIYMMALSTILSALVFCGDAPFATQDRTPALSAETNPFAPTPSTPRSSSGQRRVIYQDGGLAVVSNENSIQSLARAMKDASADEKEELEAKIQSELEKQYDEFLANNEEQIKKLQERIDNLKDQLDRRRRARSKMVELEFERMVNEADGLIWPEQGRGAVRAWRSDDPFANSNRDFPSRNLTRLAQPNTPMPGRLKFNGSRGVK